ncbi:uncharacterized protein LOC26535694 isoform X2 [Drosophila yakuba]|uniref:uncharacterized protein LOC26535694 isoform X2 n=1 Tax=Drosophila yakuba TaxID=7245 RepID=UPI001C8A9413|nr:uncharacterized protein LOC26535694 isoform X2 [Drosophila yakuba]
MQRHKMQITRRNNQIENETEQSAIKVDDEPNGNCSTKTTEQHTIEQPKGTGRTRFRCSAVQLFNCSAGQDFPTTPASRLAPLPIPFALDNTQLPAHRNQQSTNICIASSPVSWLVSLQDICATERRMEIC